MDETDRRLLALLQKDGRRASADLAKEIGLSVSATNDRVRKLIDSGAVRSIEAIVEPSLVGFGVTAFIYVDLDYEHGEQDFITAVTAIGNVLEVHHVTGTHSYLLKVREKTNQQLNAFMATQLKRLPAVRRTETLISLETLKETLNLPF
nr:Lrp/AsnC family transcriptional regulator [uncultured Cohaesibacter sp.]